MSDNYAYDSLINAVKKTAGVVSIGKTGGPDFAMDGGDVDLFVFCDDVPSLKERRAAAETMGSAVKLERMSETSGRFWGLCDFFTIEETDVCLMYFTTAEMDREIEDILSGSRLDREGNYFYPTGRCASILSLHIIYDKFGYIGKMKEKLAVYPAELSRSLYNHHMGKIHTAEDFTRAVERSDVLFFHSTIDNALDHFLQALFALNKCYFPSRKRSMQYIERFAIKPENCGERILRIIEMGARKQYLGDAYARWSALCGELEAIGGSLI